MNDVDKQLTELIYLVENAKEQLILQEYKGVLEYLERVIELSREIQSDILESLNALP